MVYLFEAALNIRLPVELYNGIYYPHPILYFLVSGTNVLALGLPVNDRKQLLRFYLESLPVPFFEFY